MPIFKIQHITKYEYNKPVKESANEITIFPYQCKEQEILQHELIITNQPDVYVYTDYWGNQTGMFNLLSPHMTLVIESLLTIRTLLAEPVSLNFQPGMEELGQEVKGRLQLLELSTPDNILLGHYINDIIHSIQPADKSIVQIVEKCCTYVFKHFKYIKGITNIETTIDEILQLRSGVCQDFAHVLLQILRTLHIPCRYVSGYICPNKNGMRGEGATHAWVEAYIPGYGWAGIDPTNNVWVTNTHVKLAVGNHFSDCTPVKGTFKGPARQKLSVYVSVGYEDGETFEEQNNVQMQTAIANDPKDLEMDNYSEQQQQQ
jgi:transglutaminase-like putative cysteine protease